jgi:hypothetical protein
VKYALLIFSFAFGLNVCAQREAHTLFLTENIPADLASPETEQPAPPVLTTHPADLEICTGKSTRLSAQSLHTIYWYTSPPPLGTPVGTGTSYVTPALNTGYYTYYAVADNNGIKSEVSAMEVVMVYPSPTVTIESSATSLCSQGMATLTASGTTYYEWEQGPVSSQMVIRPHVNTTYKVTGINTAGCKSTVAYTQIVSGCDMNTPAPEQSEGNTLSATHEHNGFAIYPNPNKGEFNIHVYSATDNTSIEVYSWLGELVHSETVRGEISAVNLNDRPDGIYIVRIIEHNKLLKQQKVVKE